MHGEELGGIERAVFGDVAWRRDVRCTRLPADAGYPCPRPGSARLTLRMLDRHRDAYLRLRW